MVSVELQEISYQVQEHLSPLPKLHPQSWTLLSQRVQPSSCLCPTVSWLPLHL